MLDRLLAEPDCREVCELSGPIGVMALHGGLEAGTAELAHLVADATGASRYAVIQGPTLRWHVPSVRFDPKASPRLTSFLRHVDVAVSIHGFGRPGLDDAVLLGGRNRSLAGVLARALRHHGLRAIDDLDEIPRPLRGLHRKNPVNLPRHRGVQLELGPDVRADLDLVAKALGAGLTLPRGPAPEAALRDS